MRLAISSKPELGAIAPLPKMSFIRRLTRPRVDVGVTGSGHDNRSSAKSVPKDGGSVAFNWMEIPRDLRVK